MSKDDQEHIARVKLKNGTDINLFRTENKAIIIRHGDHKVVMPKATGQQTFDMLMLLEQFGEIDEEV